MKKSVKEIFTIVVILFSVMGNIVVWGQKTTELTILTWAHFSPNSDEYLKKIATEFGQKEGIKVRIDTISLNDFPSKLAAEVSSGKGHDIVLLMNYSTSLYSDQLIPLNDVIEKIERIYGPYQPAAEEASKIDEDWLSVPCYYTPAPGIYREDYFREANIEAPDTWNDLLLAAEKLYKTGHPIGLPISHCGDSNDWLLQLMSSFGAHPIDQNGNITINSQQTREAIEYVKKIYQYMPSDVLSWDGAGNNRWLLSGIGSYIINSTSILVEAEKSFPEIFQNLKFSLPPSGPNGRFSTTSMYTYGIPKWSNNKDLAKSFLLYLFEKENFRGWVEASGGYNMPLFVDYSTFKDLKCWEFYPDADILFKIGDYYHLPLWPARASSQCQLIYDLYIIPDMFGNVVMGKMTVDEAIKWAEQQLSRVWVK